LIGNRVIADIHKELGVEPGEALARFFAGLQREALVTIISADMQCYANFMCDDARHVIDANHPTCTGLRITRSLVGDW
jgi:hypothetical protein